MRHKRTGRKLGVVTKHRRAMFRNMATDLFRHESITTTDARAKEIRRVAEKMITLAKKGTLQARRQAAAFIKDKDVLKKLFSELAEKYKDRPGGYTRIIKMGYRRGDNAALSMIEIVQEDYKPKKKKKKKTTPKAKQATETTKKSTKKESAEDLGLIEDGAKVAAATEAVTEDTAEQKPVEENIETAPEVKEDTKTEEVQEETEVKTETEQAEETPDVNEEPQAEAKTEAEQEVVADTPEEEPEAEAKTEENQEEAELKAEATESEAGTEEAAAPEEEKEEDKKD